MSVKFYTRSCVYLCIFYNNKVVEGSGSEGAPKYVGEGVTYRVFLGILPRFLHARAFWHALHQLSAHVCLCCHDVTSWYDVTWEYRWHHPMTYSWHHRLRHDIMGLAYKRHCAGPLQGPGVHFSSEVRSPTRVLMHTWIDALMCPHF